MEFIRKYAPLVTVAAALFAPMTQALADGEPASNQESSTSTGSDAQFDKRLPPVIPGEEVSDGKNKIKMWSTTGPVPVGEAPEPWKKDVQEIAPGGVGVIVDRDENRRDYRRR